jgi:hypothetical protein
LTVRRWAQAKAIAPQQFRAAVRASLKIGLSLLLDALRREFPDAVDIKAGTGGYCLTIGKGPIIEALLTGSPLFPPMLLASFPTVDASTRQLDRPIAAIRIVTAALASTGADLALGPMQELFLNSIANLTLNRLIGQAGLPDAAPEPAWQGHGYFPFPALRCGPSADDVSQFCNLVEPEDRVLFAHCEGLIRHTSSESMPASWDEEWSPGQRMPPDAIPLHPWTLKRSRTIRDLIEGGWLRVTPYSLIAQPLASQRTCRIPDGGYDVKLALDATLTGERRLLYGNNTANAPIVSAIAERALDYLAARLNFQTDIASFSHVVPGVSPFLSCIVRSPPRVADGESLHPAIDLWTGRCRAASVFDIDGRDAAEELMAKYALALLAGPVLAWANYGFGFEPHIQNVSIRVRGRMPFGITLRDLDATIIDPARLPPDLLSGTAGLSENAWRAMPTPQLGNWRLAHALNIGHLAMVANALHRQFGARYTQLDDAVQSAWAAVEAMGTMSDRASISGVRNATSRVKRSLSMTVTGSTAMQFS